MLITMLLLCPVPASSQWNDETSGDPLPDTGWRKAADGFGAALVVTDQIDGVKRSWVLGAGASVPKLNPAGHIPRGGAVQIVVFFALAEGFEGDLQPEVGYRILQPDGSVYADVPYRPAQGQATLIPGVVTLATASLKMIVETEDPLGRYAVVAFCRRNAAAEPLVLMRQFKVVK